MVTPGKPIIQRVIPQLQDKIQQPERDGAIRNISPIASGVFEIGQAFRRLFWFRINQTNGLAKPLAITFRPVPLGEMHRFFFIASRVGAGAVQLGVNTFYPAQGAAVGANTIEVAKNFMHVDPFTTRDHLNGRTNTNENYFNRPYLDIVPPGNLLLVTDQIGAGIESSYQIFMEILDGPLSTEQRLIGAPVITEL